MRGARATTIGLLEGLTFDKILCPSDQHGSNILPFKIIRAEPQGFRRFAGLIRKKMAPAAICRKVIEAQKNKSGEIEIWGDGEQTRSFMYIDDCIKGSTQIMESDIREPINLGSAEMVSINQLVDIAEGIAGVKLKRKYNLGAPKGVRGRSSGNTLIQKLMGWEPGTKLKDGLAKTYEWIRGEMR